MAPGGAAAPQGLLRSTRAIERANWRDGAEGPHPEARPAQRRHVAEELPADADAYRAGAQLRRVGGGRMLQRGSTVTFLSWLRSTPTPYARHAIFYRRVGYWMLPLASVCGGASDAVALGAAGASCFGACAWSGVAVTRRGPRSRHLPPPLIFIYIHI